MMTMILVTSALVLARRVKTPNYELYGAMTVDIRVNISGEGWTVNKIQFTYFANTSAKNCLAYGPGLLPQVSVRHLLRHYKCHPAIFCMLTLMHSACAEAK